jgi:hypothetical protein
MRAKPTFAFWGKSGWFWSRGPRPKRAAPVVSKSTAWRVAHRHGRHVHGGVERPQLGVDHRLLAEHGHVRGRKARRPHRDAHARDRALDAEHRARVRPRIGVDGHRRADREALGAREVEGHAAEAIAAHLGAAAVSVDHPHREAIGRTLDEEHAVGAHTAVSIADRDDLVGRERAPREVDHDEVVAEPFVLLERDAPHPLVVTPARVPRKWTTSDTMRRREA